MRRKVGFIGLGDQGAPMAQAFRRHGARTALLGTPSFLRALDDENQLSADSGTGGRGTDPAQPALSQCEGIMPLAAHGPALQDRSEAAGCAQGSAQSPHEQPSPGCWSW